MKEPHKCPRPTNELKESETEYSSQGKGGNYNREIIAVGIGVDLTPGGYVGIIAKQRRPMPFLILTSSRVLTSGRLPGFFQIRHHTFVFTIILQGLKQLVALKPWITREARRNRPS